MIENELLAEVAHHEAGHAVIACCLDVPIVYATVMPNP
jgi:hypothetical protein